MPKPAAQKPGPYQFFMLGLCILVLLALVIEVFFKLDAGSLEILHAMDTGVCAIFFLDFCVNAGRHKWKYLKWGWIDLLSSVPMVGWLRVGRLARLFRIIRLIRAVKSAKVILSFVYARRAESALMAVLMISIILVTVASVSILQVEDARNANIKTPEDALWWSFSTITTVGSGDKYPVSTEGRIIAVALMSMGVILFGTFTAFVASWFMEEEEKKEEDELAALRKELAEIKQLLMEQRDPTP